MLRVLLLLSLTAPVAAQTGYPVQKGNVSLGGTASFSSSQFEDSDRLTTLTLSPSALFFVADGLAVGGNASFIRASSDGDSSSSFGIGPRIAYYFGGPASSVYPFVSAGVAYTSLNENLSALGGEVAGGAVFMLSRSVGLSGEAYFQAQSYSFDGLDESLSGNEFGFRGGIVAFL